MKELKVGDKVRIISKDGNPSNAEILHNGEMLKTCISAEIKITPSHHITAKLEMVSPVIDITAEVSEIIDSNPKLNRIKSLVDNGSNNKKDINAIYKDIVRVFYPNG